MEIEASLSSSFSYLLNFCYFSHDIFSVKFYFFLFPHSWSLYRVRNIKYKMKKLKIMETWASEKPIQAREASMHLYWSQSWKFEDTLQIESIEYNLVEKKGRWSMFHEENNYYLMHHHLIWFRKFIFWNMKMIHWNKIIEIFNNFARYQYRGKFPHEYLW